MTTTKNEVLLGYHMKIVLVFLFGGGRELEGIKIWWGHFSWWRKTIKARTDHGV